MFSKKIDLTNIIIYIILIMYIILIIYIMYNI